MIRFLLEEIEKSPNPSFCKKELLSLSEEKFNILIKKKILIYSKLSNDNIEKLRFPRCQHGCGLTVNPVEDGYEAICLEHPEENPVLIEEDDLSRYKLSIDKLLFEIRAANRIDGDFHRIEGGYYYVGYKTYDDNRVGIVFISNLDKTGPINLTGIKHICKDDDVLLVLTPANNIDNLIIRKQLANENIVQMSLVASIHSETFELPIQERVSKLLKPKDVSHAELSAKQKKDYEKYEYVCYDKLTILGTIPMKRSNLIVVNGNNVKLGDSLFRLFLRFILELKKKNGGWVNKHSLFEEHFISDVGRFQAYSDLRKRIEGNLIVKEGARLIQNDGSENYRLSVHPDFITYDKRKLRNHPDNTIREMAKKLP